MISRERLDTSIAVSLLRYFYRWHSRIEQRLIDIYCDSQTYKLTKSLWEKVKICLRFSLLGRITEIKQVSPGALDGSRVLKYLINFYKRWMDKIIRCSQTSWATCAAKDVKTELYLSPTKIISIIVVTVIVVNVVLAFILHKQTGLWGWLMRGLFLFTGVSGLFCQADWSTIEKTSIFLRRRF